MSTEHSALIMIDLQNDFCLPGSQLFVPDSEAILPLANQLQAYFPLIIATQDWHPSNHISFADNHPGRAVGETISLPHPPFSQQLWPTHCVQNTPGAALHPHLSTTRIKQVIHKGTQAHLDSYSAFFDNAHLAVTPLNEQLQQRAINTIYFIGLALDYCVKYSALDAKWLGFETIILIDACRAIDTQPAVIQSLLEVFHQANIQLMTTKTIFTTFQPILNGF